MVDSLRNTGQVYSQIPDHHPIKVKHCSDQVFPHLEGEIGFKLILKKINLKCRNDIRRLDCTVDKGVVLSIEVYCGYKGKSPYFWTQRRYELSIRSRVNLIINQWWNLGTVFVSLESVLSPIIGNI